MNKIIVILLMALGINSYADRPLSAIELEDLKKSLVDQGFNTNGSVSLVASNKLNAPDSIKSKWIAHHADQLEKGYYHQYSNRAKELLTMKETIAFEYESSDKNNDNTATILRKNVADIKFAYAFIPIVLPEIPTILGYAASGGFHDGWDGAIEFFEINELGTCAYTENNIKISHASEKIDQDIVSYDINNKVTTIDIHGTNESGYLYTVHWADDDYLHYLECANKEYSTQLLNSYIELARKIDTR